MRQRLCISASAAAATFHAWVGEAKRIHAEEMESRSRFSHRWTSEVKPCIDLCAAATTIIIISKTKCFSFFLIFIQQRMCSETKSFDRACLFSIYFSVSLIRWKFLKRIRTTWTIRIILHRFSQRRSNSIPIDRCIFVCMCIDSCFFLDLIWFVCMCVSCVINFSLLCAILVYFFTLRDFK